MKIEASHGQPQRHGRYSALASGRLSGPRGGADDFARLLRQERTGMRQAVMASVAGVIVDRGDDVGVQFDVRTEIGDDAIRFDARPIVGDTARVNASASCTAPTSGEELPAAALPVSASVSGLLRQIEAQLPLVVERAIAMASHERPIQAAVDAAATRGASAMSTATPSALNAGEHRALQAVRSASRPTPPSAEPPPPPPDKRAPTARVAVMPREVSVLIRGVSLSARDSQTLGEAVRELLRDYRLGQHTVHIVTMTNGD